MNAPERNAVWRTGCLWNLWEMLQISGKALHLAIQSLHEMSSIMIEVEGHSLDANMPPNSQEAKDVLKYLGWLREGLGYLGARVTDMRAAEFEELVISGQCTNRLVNIVSHDIAGRLKHEMSVLELYVLDGSKEAYMRDSQPLFGDVVAKRFPLAAFDIAEAGKCFALERYTATAFHLMRVVEIGIGTLRDTLKVEVSPRAGWLKMLERIEPAIEALPDTTADERKRKQELQMARAHLHAIRIGWRNDTMHPKATYTEEEARPLMAHVETFMRHLADRL